MTKGVQQCLVKSFSLQKYKTYTGLLTLLSLKLCSAFTVVTRHNIVFSWLTFAVSRFTCSQLIQFDRWSDRNVQMADSHAVNWYNLTDGRTKMCRWLIHMQSADTIWQMVGPKCADGWFTCSQLIQFDKWSDQNVQMADPILHPNKIYNLPKLFLTIQRCNR